MRQEQDLNNHVIASNPLPMNTNNQIQGSSVKSLNSDDLFSDLLSINEMFAECTYLALSKTMMEVCLVGRIGVETRATEAL